MATVEGAGVELHHCERGSGPPVLLIHGMAADAQSWAPVAERLVDRARVIAYDRRGYGASGAPEPYECTTVYEQAEDAAALLHALGAAPATIAAEGFGALVALDLLVRHAGLVGAAVLSHPPLFAFVAQATEALGAEREQLLAVLAERGPEDAVQSWLGGRVAGEALERARRAHRGFFADFGGLSSWPVTRAQLRAIGVPVVVLTAERAPAHVAAAADALAALVPGAERRHDADIAAAVERLLAH
jgi:pimeloyl-ACP methyl ester carboxylesterase